MKTLAKYLLLSHELTLYRDGKWQFKLNKKHSRWEIDLSSVLFFIGVVIWATLK